VPNERRKKGGELVGGEVGLSAAGSRGRELRCDARMSYEKKERKEQNGVRDQRSLHQLQRQVWRGGQATKTKTAAPGRGRWAGGVEGGKEGGRKGFIASRSAVGSEFLQSRGGG